MAAEPQNRIADKGDGEPTPPTAERVARRALVLAAVAGRGLLEQEDPSDPRHEANRQRTLDWLGEVGVTGEVEPDEWEVLQRPVGKAERQAAVDAVWRLEGLAVLAWALGLRELPAYDELTEVWPLLGAVGFPHSEKGRAVLAAPSLRRTEKLDQLRRQLFALHWRLRQFSIKPERIDLENFARTAWFGPLDVSLCRLADGDLALGEHAILDAPRELYERTCSATLERHLASNWLCGASAVYSQTTVST